MHAIDPPERRGIRKDRERERERERETGGGRSVRRRKVMISCWSDVTTGRHSIRTGREDLSLSLSLSLWPWQQQNPSRVSSRSAGMRRRSRRWSRCRICCRRTAATNLSNSRATVAAGRVMARKLHYRRSASICTAAVDAAAAAAGGLGAGDSRRAVNSLPSDKILPRSL